MKKETILSIAKSCLSDQLTMPGSLLYSSHETLRPGDVYLIGFNPGGTEGGPLSKSLDTLLTNKSNAYIDEYWDNLKGESERGNAVLQVRIRWLLKRLGYNPRDVCASNLIFFQSRQARGISYNLAKKCWPVHEAIIQIVKPKLILSFGNSDASPYRYLHGQFGGDEEEPVDSGHGNWKLKGFKTSINGKFVYVAGIPHLSRYQPEGKSQFESWLETIKELHL